MVNENIFSALAKYNSAIDENYLTEAFVFVLNSLLLKERPLGVGILTQLCVNDNEFAFGPDEHVSISTQETTEEGRPDIKVSSPDKLIYVEVKHDSPLGPQQLAHYRKALDSSPATIKRIVLLTRFEIDSEAKREKAFDKHVRWFEVYNWLANLKVQDPVSLYLVESFKSFLEVKQMSIQKVTWEYINGVPALTNLLNMVGVAIQAVPLAIYKRAPAGDFTGFYLEKARYWCGIYYDDPLVLVFEITDKKKFSTKRVEAPSYPIKEDKDTIKFRLPLEDRYFFSLDKDAQLAEITNFIKKAHSDAQRMRVKLD